MKTIITLRTNKSQPAWILSTLLVIAFLFINMGAARAQTGTIVLKKTTLPATTGIDFTFSSSASVAVTSTSGLSDSYAAGEAVFGPELDITGISGTLELVNDGSGTGTDGCESIVGFTPGNIALIDRGTCNFVNKVYNAQAAGATAVVIVNNIPGGGIVSMADGGGFPGITIPSLFISYEDGMVIKNELAAGETVSVTLRGNLFDPVALQHDESITFEDVPAGKYRISEAFPLLQSFILNDIVIVDPDNGSSAFPPGYYAILDVDDGETVECTFINYSPLYTLMGMVDDLYSDGVLNAGQANALTVKGNSSLKNIEKVKFNAAINELQALINQVYDFMAEGILTPDQGMDLIDEANTMIILIGGTPYYKTAIAEAPIQDEASEYSVGQNYPNPFDGTTSISFTVPAQQKTILKVYNAMGEEVATLFDGIAQAGMLHTVEFNGLGLPEGIYFYHIQSGNDFNTTRKMVLLR